VKIQSQESKETVQILKQDSGNNQAPFYLIKNHHKSIITWIHNQFELFGSETLTLTQKNLEKSKESFRIRNECGSKHFLPIFATIPSKKHERFEQFEPVANTKVHAVSTAETVRSWGIHV